MSSELNDMTDFLDFCRKNDSTYKCEYLPENLESDPAKRDKCQKRFVAMYERAMSVIDEELPGLIDSGKVDADLTPRKILESASSQFSRQSGLRSGKHLLPNLFNKFLEKGDKFPEPAIKNPGSGKGGNSKKIELSEQAVAKIGTILDDAIKSLMQGTPVDDNKIRAEIQSAALPDAEDFSAEDDAMAEVDAALAELPASDYLTAVITAVEKIREKTVKSRKDKSAPDFEKIVQAFPEKLSGDWNAYKAILARMTG